MNSHDTIGLVCVVFAAVIRPGWVILNMIRLVRSLNSGFVPF
jgi:hypothetical protein